MMIELVDPRGQNEATANRLATRVAGASALKRIGFLSNEPEHMTGPHFPGYTRVLERALHDRLGITEFHREIKPVLSLPADAEMLNRLKRYDGVINGLAK